MSLMIIPLGKNGPTNRRDGLRSCHILAICDFLNADLSEPFRPTPPTSDRLFLSGSSGRIARQILLTATKEIRTCVSSSLDWHCSACLHPVQRHELIVILTTILDTAHTDLRWGGLLPGAAGTCARKWARIPARNTILRVLGPTTESAPAALRLERSWCGVITLARSSAERTASGSFAAATIVMLCAPVRDPWPALSRSEEPTRPCSIAALLQT
jgi:hypothetical protein